MTTMKAKYKLNCKGEFVIENYNFSKPFANFFPGIAGPYGIPIWAFYVNRGQAISSFGIKNKDHGIVEFYPANKAWQVTPLLGFRTFIKIKAAKKHLFYEPFHNGPINANFKLANRMRITSSDLTLEEENSTLGLTVKVEYFTIPNDKYGALARVVTLKNTGKAPKNFAFVDGLPQIMPFGMHGFFTKEMSRTIEAWMYVNNLDKGVPFYRLAVDPQDRPEVIHITEGNFYLGFHYQNNKPQIIKPMIDPQSVFGPITDFTSPYLFLNSANFKPPKNEISSGRTPCAFSFLEGKLTAGEEKCFYSVCGYMLNQEALNSLTPKIIKSGYIKNKQQENKTLIENIQEDINTQSSKCELDLYAKQTYLDNILRGGYPVSFKSANNQTIFYLYSRKHGDLERDYNRFQLQPTYLSQGNGNYRDISQNRRSDIWFNPDIKDENVISFFNLLQTDGFNPLVVKGTTFTLKNPAQIKDKLNGYIKSGEPEALFKLLEKPFTPGDVIIFIEENKIKLDIGYDEFLGILLTESVKHNEAEHGEGFWTDHWTYNLDLLENYLSVYPENKKEIIFDKKAFTFFDNVETVKPRSEKYMLYSDSVKQLHSIGADLVKKELIHKRSFSPHLVRKEYGIGEIYQTTLINKLLSLVANKIASLDPFGMGIEMEADKPNWYDSLNGLPALFGSSLCETLELKRYILFIKNSLIDAKTNQVTITEEILHLLNGLNELALNVTDDYLYWDQTHTLKEEYRHKTKLGLSGNEIGVPVDQLINILDNFLGKLDTGIKKAYDKKSNVYYAYFYHEVSEYEPLKDKFVKPLKFTQKKLPFFLESQVHALKITDDIKQAKMLYKGTRNSELFDTKLKMYKVCAPLKNMPEEIGRCRVFNPGWLENESIWLHMEYKYLLELLRAGLNDEFYSDFKEVLVPFQKADKYGRNILENSSFLVSSAFVDKNLHGNGFVARLSGSTAEFLSIWLLMNCGRNPFFINEKNELNLRFTPLLSGWLFDKKGNYSFNFLSKIKVTFHNPKKKNTFGANAVKVEKILFNDKNGKPIEIFNDTIPAPYASQIRSRLIKTIDIYLE